MGYPSAESAGSFDRFVSALEGAGSRIASHRSHKVKATCPAHEDATPSLAADYKSADRKTVIYCHAGCDPVDVVSAVGLTLADLYDDPMPEEKKTRRTGIPRARRAPATRTPAKKPAAPKAVKPSCAGPFAEVERYTYDRPDEARTVAGEKIRKECTGCDVCRAEGAKPAKQIHWRRPTANGSGWEARMPENPPLYHAPEIAAAALGSTIYLGEGEKVVKAAESLGLVATTKPGSASSRWNADHNALLAGKHLVILADRDEAGYKSARDARDALLADVLSVSVLQTPVEAKGADLDDHLRAGLTLADLVPVPELEDAQVLTLPAAAPMATAATMGEPIPGDDGRPNRRDEFAVRHGEIVKVSRRLAGTDEDGQPQYDVAFDTILGCYARIVRVETRDLADDDRDNPGRTVGMLSDVPPVQPTTGYVLELVHPKHLDQPKLMRVTTKAFEDGTWLHGLPWPNVYYRGNRTAIAQICSAIRELSPDAVRVPVYAATGWRRTEDNGWMYIHAAGGITPTGSVPLHTRFPGRLSLMALPEPTTDPVRLREAAFVSLGMPAQLPEYATVAMLGLVYRAPFGRCPSSICLTGLPGSGKTGVGTAILHHFAPELDRTESLLSISDTGSTHLGAIEVLYRLKDALVMGDDSAPDKSVLDAARRTSKMGRTQYNGEGKLRLKSVDGELELDEQRGPRGSFIQTAEVLASTQSAQERMFTIQMVRAEIDLDRLAHVSGPETAQACALLMASYIQWIASRYEQLHRDVRRLADTYASHLRPYCGDRPGEHLGQFAAGWHMMLRFLIEAGAMTTEEAPAWWETAWSALLDAADREKQLLENQTMHRRLLGYLATALNGKQAHLVGPDGKCPADPDTALRYGWMTTDNAASQAIPAGPTVLRAGGTQIGVVTQVTKLDGSSVEELWLDHQQATRIALRVAVELGESFTVTANVLTEALRQAGVIEVEHETTKNGRMVKARKPMPGGRRRVWAMPSSAVTNFEDGDSGTSGGGTDRPPAPPAPQPTLFDWPPSLSQPPASPAPPRHGPAVAIPAPQPPPAPTPVPAGEPVSLELPLDDEEAIADCVREASAQEWTGIGQQAVLPASESVFPLADADAVQAADDEDQVDEQSAAPATPWRAAAAVAHVDGLYLPDGTVLPLPPLEALHAGFFADLCVELGLGHGGAARGSGPSAKWRPDDGQIYLTTALTEALGLPVPEDGPADERRAFLAEHVDHPFLARARADGWTVAKWGAPTRIWRKAEDGGRNQSAQLVCVPHVELTTRFLEDRPSPALLAQRLQQLADTIGITYRSTPGVTGHDLLRATRPKNGHRADPLVRATMPPLLMDRRNMYIARVWDRQPTKEELLKRFVLLFDCRASYLSVCSALHAGRGEFQHLTAPEFNPKVPGLWLAKAPAWEQWGCFDPFGPRRDDNSARWYQTPTLAYAQQDLKADIEVIEAYVWPDHYRMLEPWYRQLAGARKAITSDTDAKVAETLKDVYTNSIGLFNSDHLLSKVKGKADSDTFRPDVQQAVLAAQQANLARTILRVGNEHGMWPLAVKTDMLAYATDDPNFFTAVPGLRMEADLGHFKPEGAALASDIYAHLRPGKGWFPAGSAFTPAEEWGEG